MLYFSQHLQTPKATLSSIKIWRLITLNIPDLRSLSLRHPLHNQALDKSLYQLVSRGLHTYHLDYIQPENRKFAFDK